MQYLSLEEVLYLHSRIIKRTGGKAGVRDLGLLESAIHRPAASFGGEDLYPSLYDKSAALVHSLINNHPFTDGNKRTGYVGGARFLFVNGYELHAPNGEALDFVLGIESKRLSLDAIAKWFKRHAKKAKTGTIET